MINFICGKIVEIHGNTIIMENNGIGYELTATLTAVQNSAVGEQSQIFTYLNINDNQFLLYGFSGHDEREMFLKLITVGGIGPKLAIGILSGISLRNLSIAIISGDAATLSKLKGVGKKTAERIILELKEKITNVANEVRVSAAPSLESEITVAQATLVALGIGRSEAGLMAREAAEANDTAETIVLKALRGNI